MCSNIAIGPEIFGGMKYEASPGALLVPLGAFIGWCGFLHIKERYHGSRIVGINCDPAWSLTHHVSDPSLGDIPGEFCSVVKHETPVCDCSANNCGHLAEGDVVILGPGVKYFPRGFNGRPVTVLSFLFQTAGKMSVKQAGREYKLTAPAFRVTLPVLQATGIVRNSAVKFSTTHRIFPVLSVGVVSSPRAQLGMLASHLSDDCGVALGELTSLGRKDDSTTERLVGRVIARRELDAGIQADSGLTATATASHFRRRKLYRRAQFLPYNLVTGFLVMLMDQLVLLIVVIVAFLWWVTTPEPSVAETLVGGVGRLFRSLLGAMVGVSRPEVTCRLSSLTSSLGLINLSDWLCPMAPTWWQIFTSFLVNIAWCLNWFISIAMLAALGVVLISLFKLTHFVYMVNLVEWMVRKMVWLLGFLRRRAALPPPGSFFQPDVNKLSDIWTHAVVEELVKYFCWPSVVVITGIEFLACFRMGRGMDYLPTMLMHFLTASGLLTIQLACVMHFVFNVAVVTQKGSLLNTIWGLDCFDYAVSLRGVCPAEAGMVSEVQDANVLATAPVIIPCKPRYQLWRYGPSVAHCFPCVFRSCAHTEWEAVCRRVGSGVAPWVGQVGQNLRIWRAVRRFINNKPSMLLDGSEIAEDFDSWNERYPLKQRQLNILGTELYDTFGYTSRSLRVAAFIKIEKLPRDILDNLPKPRLIQGRSDCVKSVTGPWFNGFSKALSLMWSVDSQVYYTSGDSAEQVGAWASEMESRGWLPYAFDGKAWDTSVGPGPFQFSRWYYRRCKAPVHIREFLDTRRGSIHLRTKGGVRASRFGQVCSGDADTSGGNSLIHGSGWCYVMHQLSVIHDHSDTLWAVMVNGDDSVLALHPSLKHLVDEIVHWWTLLGFNFELVSSGNWDTTEFCSGHFWHTSIGRVFGPRPGRVLYKTFWSTTKYRNPRPWLRAVCSSLQYNGHVPILGLLLSRLTQLLGEGPLAKLPTLRYETIKASTLYELDERAVEQFMEIYDLDLESYKSMVDQLVNMRRVDHVFETDDFIQMCESVVSG
jgi:hypothetical protein